MLDYLEKKEKLANIGKLQIPPSQKLFRFEDIEVQIKKYQKNLYGEHSGFEMNEYRFTQDEQIGQQSLNDIQELTLSWNYCRSDTGKSESALLLISLVEWEKSSSIINADIYQEMIKSEGSCETFDIWKDEVQLTDIFDHMTTFNFSNKNYLLFTESLSEPTHTQIQGKNSLGEIRSLPDRYYHIEASSILLTGTPISHSVKRKAYDAGTFENFDYEKLNFP